MGGLKALYLFWRNLKVRVEIQHVTRIANGSVIHTHTWCIAKLQPMQVWFGSKVVVESRLGTRYSAWINKKENRVLGTKFGKLHHTEWLLTSFCIHDYFLLSVLLSINEFWYVHLSCNLFCLYDAMNYQVEGSTVLAATEQKIHFQVDPMMH